MYNLSFSSILYSRFINFVVSCFNTENDNLLFIARITSVSPKHCFYKNLYTAYKDFQLPLTSPLVNVLCEFIFSGYGLFEKGLCHSDIEFLLHEICCKNL